MSYGIICREPGCRAVAEYRYALRARAPDGVGASLFPAAISYVCEAHAARQRTLAAATNTHITFERLGDADHRGPEGMKSLEDQGKT